MKKNLIIAALVVLAALSIETAVFYRSVTNKQDKKLRSVAMALSDARQECEMLRRQNRDLRIILDSIDNPHHHDYLLTLPSYRALQKY